MRLFKLADRVLMADRALRELGPRERHEGAVLSAVVRTVTESTTQVGLHARAIASAANQPAEGVVLVV